MSILVILVLELNIVRRRLGLSCYVGEEGGGVGNLWTLAFFPVVPFFYIGGEHPLRKADGKREEEGKRHVSNLRKFCAGVANLWTLPFSVVLSKVDSRIIRPTPATKWLLTSGQVIVTATKFYHSY